MGLSCPAPNLRTTLRPLENPQNQPYVNALCDMFFYVFLNNKEHVKTWAIFRVLNLEYVYIYIPVVPHKAVAEVSKIGNLKERLVVVNHGWQSEATDGSKGDWCLLSFSLFLWLSTYLSIYLFIYLSIFYLSIYLSFCLSIYLSNLI